MKKLIIWIIVMPCLSSAAHSQNRSSFGINGGMALPVGALSSSCGPGVHFGIIARVPTSNPNLRFAMGGGISILSGKWQAYPLGGSYETDYKPVSFFAGIQIDEEKGAYFLPSVALNASDDGARIGFDLRIGGLVPINDGDWCFDLGVKFSLMNLIMKESGEENNVLLLFFGGLAF